MAKKAMGKTQGGKDQTLCIKMVKDPKNDSYYFKEEVVTNDRVEDFFKEKERNGGKEEQAENSG